MVCAVLIAGGFAIGIGTQTYGSSATRKQVAESIKLAEPVQRAVERAYAKSGELPADLAAAGFNAADYQSKYVTAIDVIDGVVLIYYGNEADPKIATSAVSLRPAVLDGGRVIWSCGYFRGTNIDAEYLPSACQATSP